MDVLIIQYAVETVNPVFGKERKRTMEQRISFSCDYMEGAHPTILQRLIETNFAQMPGYGADDYCESAREKIRAACSAPNAEVHFLVGGTQTNATVIDALLRSYQGVVAADTGHISVHEAGAIEFGGHKVLTLPHRNGKISAEQIASLLCVYEKDVNHDHTVMPGMVYLSQPTEYGTLYSREELSAISALCREKHLPLYVDGARLAYALACPENDVTLKDMNITINDAKGSCLYVFEGGKATVKSGSYTNTNTSGEKLLLNQKDNKPQAIFVEGGTFNGRNPESGDNSGNPSTFLAPDYKSVETSAGSGIWTVSKMTWDEYPRMRL